MIACGWNNDTSFDKYSDPSFLLEIIILEKAKQKQIEW